MHTQTQDIIRMLCVETLRMFLTVVNDSDGSDVVHDLARLQIEEIIAAVVSTVTETIFQGDLTIPFI